MKKMISILLALTMALSLAACSKSGQNNETPAPGTTAAAPAGTSAPAEEKTDAPEETPGVEYPDYVTGPITIEFWHTMGSGTQAEYIEDAVNRFNSTNTYGITVNPTYIGDYGTLRANLTTSIGAQENPQVSVLGMSDILASMGVLADMTLYAERDGIDPDAFIEGVQTSMYYEGQLTALPLIRSCSMFYYNVDQFAQAGYDTPPTTVEEMMKACKAVAEQQNNYGFGGLIDMSFYFEALLQSLGSEGLIDKDKQGASCLDDGTFLQILTDWRKMVDEGWCAIPAASNAQNTMFQMMYTGELASMYASSASMTTLIGYAKEAGQNIAAAPMPTYNGLGGVGGGGDISIIAANNNQQQIAASWEFVKFMMSDEEVATRSKATGYLPTSQGAADLMSDVLENDPNMKAAYEARIASVDVPGCTQRSSWQTQAASAVSYVIQDKSMTPEEAIAYLKDQLGTVFTAN